jgi:hypothetical protein
MYDMEAKHGAAPMVHSPKPIRKPKPRTSGALSNARVQNMLSTRDERIAELQQELDAARKRIAELERELAAAHAAN